MHAGPEAAVLDWYGPGLHAGSVWGSLGKNEILGPLRLILRPLQYFSDSRLQLL